MNQGAMVFRLADLPDLRDFAAVAARRIGMTEDAVGDVILAVNEIATNAVTHGTAKAQLRIWTDAGDLFVEIHDDGAGWLPDVPPAPGPRATSGMGLWVARRLAADLSFATGVTGSTVTMRFAGRA